jgi:hypothetical protein
MPTTRPLRTAWKSLWNKSRSGRRLPSRPSLAESLETRLLPAAVTITASVDGYARDADRDNVFTVLDETSETLLTRASTSSQVGIERSMFEFDLTSTSNALSINSATFIINVSQVGKNGTILPKIELFGYDGDGTLTLADATAAGTNIASATVTQTGELRLNLNLDFVRSQFGDFLGIRVENAVLNGPFAVYTSLEGTAASAFPAPRLELDINDTTFEVDEQRPNGHKVGSIGIGTGATYTVLGGDPGNVFALNPVTGVITVADSSQLTFATQQQYVLTVQADLADGSSGVFDVTINVKNVFGPNNEPIVTASQFELPEFSPVGTVVGKVDAYDPDSADALEYKITNGNLDNAFKINPNTGVITVNNQNALSFLKSPSIVLTVAVRDTRNIPARSLVYQHIQIFLTPSASSNYTRIIPVADGEARDVDNNGVFDAVDTAVDTMFIRQAAPGVIGRRPIMEFDLSGISSGKVVKQAFLTFYVSTHTGNDHPISVFGYTGNGVISASDAILGSLIGSDSFTVTNNGDHRAYTIELTPALIQSLLGTQSELGIVLRNDANLNILGIDSIEGPVNQGNVLSRQPSLNIVFDDQADDVIFRNNTNGTLTIARSDGTMFTPQSGAAFGQGITFSEILTGDFNGDGRIDMAGRNSANGQVLVALASGNQFVASQTAWTTLPFASTMKNLFVGDFNGDGRDDIVGQNAQGQLLVAQSTGAKFNNVVYETLPANLRTLSNVKVGDFNGDGRDDLVGIHTTTGQVVVSISNGATFTSTVWGTVPATTTADVQVGDFNGDGRDDLFTRQGARNLFVLRSTGTAFVSSLFGALVAGVPYIGLRVGDFNGDGLDDILAFTGTGASTIYRSNGVGFVIKNGGTLPVPLSGITPSNILIGDFNRDGKDDVLIRRTLTTTVNKVTTTTQQLFVAAGTDGGVFNSTLFGTLLDPGPLTLLGVGNF